MGETKTIESTTLQKEAKGLTAIDLARKFSEWIKTQDFGGIPYIGLIVCDGQHTVTQRLRVADLPVGEELFHSQALTQEIIRSELGASIETLLAECEKEVSTQH